MWAGPPRFTVFGTHFEPGIAMRTFQNVQSGFGRGQTGFLQQGNQLMACYPPSSLAANGYHPGHGSLVFSLQMASFISFVNLRVQMPTEGL